METLDFKKAKALFMDFDGVLTDNRVLVDETGKESVFCNRSDGFGISLLKKKGISVLVISSEKNPAVNARCSKLEIPCIQSAENKIQIFRSELKKRGLQAKDVIFVGNDLNDLECLKEAGIGVAVADAMPPVIKIANYVTTKKGGHGAVREIIDLILQ